MSFFVRQKNHAQRRIALISLMLVLLTALMVTVFSAIYYDRFTTDTCTEDARRFRETLTDSLGYLDFDKFGENEDDVGLYDALKDYLRRLCASSGIEYIYLFTAAPDDDQIHYIMCVSSDPDKDAVIEKERGRNVSVAIGDRTYIDKALNGELGGPERLNNEFGRELTYFFPMYDENGQMDYIVGIDYNVSQVKSQATGYMLTMVITVTLVLLAVMTVLLLVLRRKLFIPVKRISEQMNSFDPEEKHEKLRLNSYFEIEEINESFNKMSQDITGYILNIRSMADERAKSAAELDIARRIQLGMVPPSLSRSGSGFEVYASALPAREVGGDLYDFFEADGRVCALIADVSGKGIAAALFMAMAKNIIKGRLQLTLDPAAALNLANSELCAENPEGMFVTVFAAVLDTMTGELIYANAGHTRPLLCDSRGSRLLEPQTGIALGLFEDSDIVNESVILENGACVTIYTDGITEAVSAGHELFGEERLVEAAVSGTAEETVLSVTDAVDRFSSGSTQADDITVLGVRFVSGDRMEREELPPEMKSLDRMRSMLLELAEGFENKLHIALACEEIFVNIIEYSGTDSIGVLMSLSGGCLRVRFEDGGEPFDPLSEMPAEKDFDDCDMGGMGIRLVTKIADSVRYSRVGDRNIIVMSFSSGGK